MSLLDVLFVFASTGFCGGTMAGIGASKISQEKEYTSGILFILVGVSCVLSPHYLKTFS